MGLRHPVAKDIKDEYISGNNVGGKNVFVLSMKKNCVV